MAVQSTMQQLQAATSFVKKLQAVLGPDQENAIFVCQMRLMMTSKSVIATKVMEVSDVKDTWPSVILNVSGVQDLVNLIASSV